MHGYQIRLIAQNMYLIQELIRNRQWEALARMVQLNCPVEAILFEIEEYPGELSPCDADAFFDAMRFGDFDGYRVDTVAQFWVDGSESELSIECCFTFHGKELKGITLETVHVF